MIKVNPRFHLDRESHTPTRDHGVSYRETGWQQRAACSTAGLPPEEAKRRQELFVMRGPSSFYRYANQPLRHPAVREAVSFCHACPVREDCRRARETTADFPMVGVWHGEYISYDRAKDELAKARGDTHTRHTPNGWD